MKGNKTMQTVNLIQGSPEWHAHRAKHFNASDAPAMMGCSPYKTRDQLLREMKTGITAEVDAATQRRFDDGHRYEALARPCAERLISDDLYPVTGTNGIYSASFDGITLSERIIFEHKTINDELRACERQEDLPMLYRVQIEHQFMVSDADECLFMASKWDANDEIVEEVHFLCRPDHDLRARIVAGWNQLADDLASYVPQEIIPAPVATPQAQLPAVSVQVLGSIEVRDNLTAFGAALCAYVERINRQPETDQDFADLEATVKTLKEAETALDAAENGALAQAASIDQMRRIVGESRELARTTRLTIEKLVDAEKKNRREKIVSDAKDALRKFVAELNARVKFMPEIPADFAGVIKGKKTLASIKNATDTELARAKCDASMIADMIDANIKVYGELAAGYESLFADLGKLVNQPPEFCRATIENRVTQQKAKDEARRAAEAERIRAEEREKIEREQVEQRRIAALWDSAMMAAVADEQRKAGEVAADAIKQDAALESTSRPLQPTITENSAWAKARDAVAAMLEDMTVSELSLARIAIAKIRNGREQRAA